MKQTLVLIVLLGMSMSTMAILGPNTLPRFYARWNTNLQVNVPGHPPIKSSGEVFVDKDAQVLRLDGDYSFGTKKFDRIEIDQGQYHWHIYENVTEGPNPNITCTLNQNQTSVFLNKPFTPEQYKGQKFIRGRLCDHWTEVPVFGRSHMPVDYYEDFFTHQPVQYQINTPQYNWTMTFSDFGEPPVGVETFTLPKHITCDGSNENNIETRPEHIPPRPGIYKDWMAYIGYSSSDKKINGRGFFAVSHDANAVHWQGDFYNPGQRRWAPPADVRTVVYHDGKLTVIHEHDDDNDEDGPISCKTTFNDTNPWIDLFGHHAYHKAKYMGMVFINNGFRNARLCEHWANVSLPSFGSANFTDDLYIDAFTKEPVRLSVQLNSTTLYVNFYYVDHFNPVPVNLFQVPSQLKCQGPPASGIQLHKPPRNPEWHSYFFQSIDGKTNHTRDFGRLYVDSENQFFRSDNRIHTLEDHRRFNDIYVRYQNMEYNIQDKNGQVECTFNWNQSRPIYGKDPFEDAKFEGVVVKRGRFCDKWSNVHLFAPALPDQPPIPVTYYDDLFTHDIVALEYNVYGMQVNISMFLHSNTPTKLDYATVDRKRMHCRDVTHRYIPPVPPKANDDEKVNKDPACHQNVEPGAVAGISIGTFVVGIVIGAVVVKILMTRKQENGAFNQLEKL